MAKHRKTRQEKMVADHRHSLYHLETKTAEADTPVSRKEETPAYSYRPQHPGPTHATASYAYVAADLRKTAFISAAIIIAQIFLFITLNRI